MSSFRFVLLRYPYANWENKEMRDMFGKMIRLKLRGYISKHFNGVLPFDTSDFLADHLLVCKETDEGLEPFMGYRSMPLSRADFHQIPFGAMTLCQMSHGPEHEHAVLQIMNEVRANGKELYYDSAYTIDPKIKNDPVVSPHLKNLILAKHVLHHENLGSREVIAGGNMRFKMERLYHFWGYDELAMNGKSLDPLVVPFYAGDKITVYHLTRWNEDALSLAATYKLLWSQRVVIGDDVRHDTAKQAA